MKKILSMFVFLLPIIGLAQQPWSIDSPLTYTWMYPGNNEYISLNSRSLNLAFNPVDGHLYVVFVGGQYGPDGKASVMYLNNDNWTLVGNAGFTAASIYSPSLAFSPLGIPYVAYCDSASPYKASVMKYNGANWEYVGNPGFSPAGASRTSLAFSPAGEPTVAFNDWNVSGRVSVMKFDGSAWHYVGSAGFSTGMADDLSFAYSPSDGQPYVVFSDFSYDARATVMKYDGTTWVYVGIPGFSAGNNQYTCIAFNPLDGQPYVAYCDWVYTFKATVMKYDGTTWSLVGPAGFTESIINSMNLAFSLSGQAYVVYQVMDFTENKATVKKFTGTSWVPVGDTAFSPGQAFGVHIAINPADDKPYVGFTNSETNSNGAVVMNYDSVYVGIKEKQTSGVSLYPNPANNYITIEASESLFKSQLSILNLYGQQLISHQITDPQMQIDISTLPDGIYFVQLTGEENVSVGKFIKQ